MRSKIYGIFLICFFGICMSVNAQETPEVYNRDEKVMLNHELFYYDEQYYFHMDDLEQLGLDVIENDGEYTITSNDCLGEERELVIKQSNGGFVIFPSDELFYVNNSYVSVKKLNISGTYKKRSVQKIGNSIEHDIILPNDIISFSYRTDIMIQVGDEHYISSGYLGYLSHVNSLQNGRLDLFISNANSVIMETTVNLLGRTVAPTGGYNVDIYTAYKTGDGDSLSDFEILSSTSCTVLENESSAKCFVETPAEKINSNNIYFIADFGNRYALAYNEYDFSKVGTVLVYGQQKDIIYTANVALPEIDEVDVPFTVYVDTDENTYSKEGVIKAGEISTVLDVTGLPVTGSYSTRIEFGYHKYKNAYLKEVNFIDSRYARDFESDFTAELSREVVCTISLPDGYVAEGDIEVDLTLSKYFIKGMVVVDSLTDWEDKKTVILNNENRSQEVCLYNQASESMLKYRLKKDVDGLCREGYLYKYSATSDKEYAQKIKENLVAEMSILQRKNIKVTVNRPYRLSTDNDIFAYVNLYESSRNNLRMDFTNTPLIASGERKSEFEFEIIEDETYRIDIANITGDDRLFDYCWYVRGLSSVAESDKYKPVTFNDDSISLTLLECNNISGTVLCEDSSLDFEVFAFCELYNGNILEMSLMAENGKFSFKIPEDTEFYKLSVETKLGEKSYYVSDGVSTNDVNAATEFMYENDDDKNVIIRYIMRNPLLPIDISTELRYDYFVMKNVSDYLIDSFDAYIAYYDKNESLISVEKIQTKELGLGTYLKIPINTTDYKIAKAKAFAWKKDELIPIGDTEEKGINMPSTPDRDFCLFTANDVNAVINNDNVVLSKAPIEIDGDLYIGAEDFEKIGYIVSVNGSTVSIENDKLNFEFEIGEYTAIQTIDNWSYELWASILDNDGIIIPIMQVSHLFEKETAWYGKPKVVILNLPFSDVEYSNIYREAIYAMHYKGILMGYEDGTFLPFLNVMRSEAAKLFSTTMGYWSPYYAFDCSDVPLDHWAKSYVGICIDEGVFELEDNKFRPNDNITVEESIIATLKMMGVYSQNYMEVAGEYGILENINTDNLDRDITRAEMAQLLYNAGNM